MQEVTLHQMLDAREMRAALQKRLIEAHKVPLICFTMNIAGPIKNSPLIERSFFEGIGILESRLPKENVIHREIDVSVTGCQAMFCVAMNASDIKELCINIEDGFPMGRLFDIDVIDTDKSKLSRKEMRRCIVCGALGHECAAGRRHSVQQLQATTNKIITEYFFPSDCKQIANLATDSLLEEVYTTPKPGLVDRRNNGSHLDMDIHTFIKSAHSLTPYFYECMTIGHQTSDQPPRYAFEALRKAGLTAEKTMYQATEGVNTHKGAIYSMGVICGAIGRLWSKQGATPKLKDILCVCSQLTADAVEEDFASIDKTTSGGRAYLEYGLRGIRGEVAAGFPSVADIGLPVYKKELERGLSANDAGVITLIHLICGVKDTNLYRRGGPEGALYAAESAKKLLDEFEHPPTEKIKKLDDDFIIRNLSPGGCADLLAVTYFLAKFK